MERTGVTEPHPMLATLCLVMTLAVPGMTAVHSRGSVDEGCTLPAPWTQSPGNPRRLRVAQWLGEPRAGAGVSTPVRVRFEWDQVPGARAYLLSGRWAGGTSWAVRSAEHRVTPATATRWGQTTVDFDLTLPPGSHSWMVVALFGPNDTGDFENATRLRFEVH